MKRNTIQRSLTLETVKNLNCHPTADQVYEEVHLKHPNISRGTIYRNLNQLAEDGKIAAREIPGTATHFDPINSEHYHTRCVICGRVFDVDLDVIPDLLNNIKDTHGFVFSGYDIVFKGICKECQKDDRDHL